MNLGTDPNGATRMTRTQSGLSLKPRGLALPGRNPKHHAQDPHPVKVFSLPNVDVPETGGVMSIRCWGI